MRAAALVGLVALFVSASTAAAAVYHLSVTREGEAFHARAVAHIDAAPRAVRAVLLDFRHFTELSSTIVTARIMSRPDARSTVVYTEARGCLSVFCATLRQRQEFTETSPRRIVVVTLPGGGNVRKGAGSWVILPEGRGTRLEWKSTVEPAFWLPPLIGPALVRKALESQGWDFTNGIERLARSKEAGYGRW